MFVKEHFDRFMNFVFDPECGGCYEFVSFGGYENPKDLSIVPAKFQGGMVGGWFSDRQRLRDFAKRLDGVSAHITFNPVNRDFLAKIGNKVGRIQKGEGTTKSDIIFRRFILIDIDYERPKGVSATASELEEAFTVRNRILADDSRIAENSIWGCSGNGAWILTRIPDLPNDAKSSAYVERFLKGLENEYGKKGKAKAHVDVSPRFANAHIGLPGTLKCKGTSTDERPHRIITVDGGAF